MRWVLDTNVIVSALLFRGAASRLHRAWRGGEVRLLVDRALLLELARVLAYPKFRLSEEMIPLLLEQEILPFCEVVPDAQGPAVSRDPHDDKFLHVARAGRADALVSGDRDLLVLGNEWEGVPILTLREAIDLLDPEEP